jgi:hypothetical protein
MSDSAVATVTKALCRLLLDESQRSRDHVPGTRVTTLPLDKAQDEQGNRLNLFLYQVTVNGAWRNLDPPAWQRAGGQGSPPLAVDLFYLVTAYTPSGEEANLTSQQLLGQAMRIFHDHAVLNPSPHKQIEGIRITPQPLSLDEMSKLWTTFQSQYRTSVAYQVSVVLVESEKEAVSPLPVLQRGRDDQGVITQPDLIPPGPTLTELVFPKKQPALHLRDPLTIRGHHLQGEQPLQLRLIHPRREVLIENINPVSPNQIDLNLGDQDQPRRRFPPGLYRLAVVVPSGEGPRLTNEVALPLAPKILGLNAHRSGGKTTLTVTCEPNFLSDQQVTLFVGSKAFTKYTFATDPDDGSPLRRRLIFEIEVDPGQYLVRLRVDGVDSLPVADYTAVPLTFDAAQMITIHG